MVRGFRGSAQRSLSRAAAWRRAGVRQLVRGHIGRVARKLAGGGRAGPRQPLPHLRGLSTAVCGQRLPGAEPGAACPCVALPGCAQPDPRIESARCAQSQPGAAGWVDRPCAGCCTDRRLRAVPPGPGPAGHLPSGVRRAGETAMSAAYFITGTDTDVGKTTIAAGLLHAARLAGKSTAAGKPVASGCQVTAKGLRNADALALLAECSLPLSYAEVNPMAFEPAIAPHLAAREAGVALTVQSLLKPMQQILDRKADFTLIEGAGGWRVPLADQDNLSDLAMALQLPVILVVGVRLGCISHALLTAEAIARDGLPLAGWVANIIDPKTSRLEENLATLAERLPAPCLGRVPKLKHAGSDAVAEYLQLDLLDRFWLSARHCAISVFDGPFARMSASIQLHDSLSRSTPWKSLAAARFIQA